MGDLATLFDLPIEPLVDQPSDATLTIQQRFEAFHTLNPWVLAALEELAADYIKAGHRRIGIRMLWEVLRWHYNRTTADPTSTFKVNDHYHSRYVRLLLERHPEWAPYFETRVLRAA